MRYLPHHTVRTAFQEGWAMLANGDLLTAAEAAGFDVFVTTDKNLRYQQDLSKRRIAVVVLGHAQWPWLEPHAFLVVAAIDRATPGGYEEVAIPVE
jgi:putative NIF3 family GTP cyclohydrolase 1 type 2